MAERIDVKANDSKWTVEYKIYMKPLPALVIITCIAAVLAIGFAEIAEWAFNTLGVLE